MMIYTGYFDQVEKYLAQGFCCVSIAGRTPEGFQGVKYPKLAPLKSWWTEWKEKGYSESWYIKQYQETVLGKLVVEEVMKDFQSLGNRIILLCYENPYEFCHRHLVAAWFRKQGVEVNEYD